MTSAQAKEFLSSQVWEEGKIFPVTEGPYRYRVVVHCSASGRQRAMFANGEHPYFCYIELLSGNGQWIQQGNGIAPVLPDGRVLFVVEQRPPQSRHGARPTVAVIGGREIDLAQFGSHSSLELPGGAVDPGVDLKMGALQELREETEVGEQEAWWYHCCRPVHLFGSDIAIHHHSNAVFLSGFSYQEKVKTDGGLQVFGLMPEEIRQNIWNGVICSGQAALTTLNFYMGGSAIFPGT